MFDPPCMQIPSDAAVTAEGRARLYAFLANSWRYPDRALIDAIRNCEDRGFLTVSGNLYSDAINSLVAGLSEICDELCSCPVAETLEQLRVEHMRLFGHSVRGNCPPYELEYGRSEIIQQTAELADLSGFYRAFGLLLQEKAFERGDHISVECEFLSVLCAKQSWGLREEQSELIESCWDAQRLFLRDHLARWSPAFAHRVLKAGPHGFYVGVASLTSTWIEEECRRFEISAGPQWLELRPSDPERDAAIDCESGGCTAAPAEQFVQVGTECLLTAGRAN